MSRAPFKIKLPNGQERKFTIPTTWHDVTMREFIGVVNLNEQGEATNEAKLLSVLSGIEYDTILNMHAGFVYDHIMPCIDFLQSEAIDYKSVADMVPNPTIDIGGKEYNVTGFNPSKMITRYAIMYQNIGSSGKIKHDKYARCVALCLCDVEPTSVEAVDELEQKVLDLPATTVMNLHSFFLGVWLSSSRVRIDKAIAATNLPKLQRGLKNYGNTGGFIRSIFSRMGTKRKNRTT